MGNPGPVSGSGRGCESEKAERGNPRKTEGIGVHDGSAASSSSAANAPDNDGDSGQKGPKPVTATAMRGSSDRSDLASRPTTGNKTHNEPRSHRSSIRDDLRAHLRGRLVSSKVLQPLLQPWGSKLDERPQPGRHDPGIRVAKLDRHGRRLERFQHPPQRALPQA